MSETYSWRRDNTLIIHFFGQVNGILPPKFDNHNPAIEAGSSLEG